jgi:riboflavin kinase/FMN adenylyltransferase
MTALVASSTRLWRGLAAVPADWGPCVVTIGVFDGVHRGHADLIRRTVAEAARQGIPAVLVTFDPHPARVIGASRDTAALSTVTRRADLAADLGIDAVLALSFTRQLAATPAEDFARQVLVEALRASAVVVGRNFRFGARAAGDLTTLSECGRRWGFAVEGVALVPLGGERCSSTHVRARLRDGDIRAATAALGRPHRVEGTLLSGGRLQLPGNTALPPTGTYPAELTIDSTHRFCVQAAVQDADTVALVPPPPAGPHAALDFLPGSSPTATGPAESPLPPGLSVPGFEGCGPSFSSDATQRKPGRSAPD